MSPRARRWCKWSGRQDGPLRTSIIANHLAEPGKAVCIEHAREEDRLRGSRAARGYGADHVRLRRWWEPRVAKGNVKCARCRELIDPLDDWALDHTDDRTGYRGPAHRDCNESAPKTRRS